MAGRHGGPRPNSGPKKGSKHKTTIAVKECIQAAFEKLGGVKALKAWAEKNPGEFYTKIWSKLLPHEVTGADGGPLTVTIVGPDAEL